MKKIRLILPLIVACSTMVLHAQEEQMPMMGMGAKKWTAAHRQMYQEMTARWNEQDTRLDQLLRDARAAQGDQKVDALQALVAEMVAQRREMHERMVKMHDRMMEMWGQPATSGTLATPTPGTTP